MHVKTKKMHLPTINQINGRLLNQPAIKEYLFNSTDKQQWNHKNYKNRYFNFVFLNHRNEPRQYNLSINGNFIFCAAMKELTSITGTKNDHTYRNKTEKTYYLGNLYFTISTKLDFEGVNMKVITNFKALGTADQYESRIFKTFKVKSNKTFADFDQAEYLEKVLSSYFFSEGLFKKIQIEFNLDKKQVAAKYKELLKEKQQQPAEFIDRNMSIIRRIKKKLNVAVDQYEIFSERTLLHFLKTNKRYKHVTQAVKAPSMFELLEDASQNFDDEEEMINYAYETLNEFSGKILI